MNNEEFYPSRNFDEYIMNRESWGENAATREVRHDTIPDEYDIDGQPFDPGDSSDNALGASSFEYDNDNRMVGGSGERSAGVQWRDHDKFGHVQDDFVRSKDRQSARSPRQDDKYSSRYRDYSEDVDRKSRSRGYGHGTEDQSGRGRQRSRSRERDRVRDSRDGDRSKDRDRRTRRDDSGYGIERENSDYRSRRRSRSRDRDRDRDRDRRHRDSDRDRRHRDSDRDRPRRDHVRDRESSPKEVPWVPPPLPEHLRHLQVQWALTPVDSSQQPASSGAGILGAAPLPGPQVQNQFQNDGSFLEMFRQKMQQQQQQQQQEGVPVLDDSNTCEGPATSGVGAVVEEAPTSAVPAPTLPATSSGLPVIARRRISKILKTGVVQKKKKEEEEEPEKETGDGWSSYMKEVQRYRANKCIENEASRPSLVK